MHAFKPWFPGPPSWRWWARIGAFLFSAAFLCGGLLAFYQMTLRPGDRWLGARSWERADALIESSRLASAAGDEGGKVHSIDVRYSWNRFGTTHQGSLYGFGEGKTRIAVARMRQEVDRLVPGMVVDCWVNPGNPTEAVLVRSLPSSAVLGGFFSLPFLTVGILGTGWSLFGAALARRTRQRQADALRSLHGSGLLDWPSPEGPEFWLDSAGMRSIFARTERAGAAVGITAVTLFWNGIVAVFVVVAISELLGGSRGTALGLSLFLLPFIAIGGVLAWVAGISWCNLRRPDWLAVIHPLPGLAPVQSRIAFANGSAGRQLPLDFARLRLVAMAAPWDSESNRPQRSPLALLKGSKRRPGPRETGKPPSTEHELASLELPLPRPGSADLVLVPAMPDVAPDLKKRWGRWWALEIEHRDGRLETFEVATE